MTRHLNENVHSKKSDQAPLRGSMCKVSFTNPLGNNKKTWFPLVYITIDNKHCFLLFFKRDTNLQFFSPWMMCWFESDHICNN